MGLFSRLFGDRFAQPPPDEPRLSDAAIMSGLYPFGAQLTTCSGQLIPDTELSFSSATAGANPSLN